MDELHPPVADVATAAIAERHEPLVALVGPPNSGKTTLFNQLTGLRQKVANYPGVTVEKHVGQVRLDTNREIDLVDLPGVHGFSARTLDERVTRDVLEGKVEGIRPPDALVLIVDSTRLENQLMLVEPVLELGLPTLLVLNMCDELSERGGSVNDEALAERLGVDIVRTSARRGEASMGCVRISRASTRPMARLSTLSARSATRAEAFPFRLSTRSQREGSSSARWSKVRTSCRRGLL